MRLLIVIALAALLTACGTTPKQLNPVVGTAESGPVVAASLSVGPCEMSIAPAQTRVSVAMQKAQRRLHEGVMDVATADRIANEGREILARLGTVCKHESAGNTDAANNARDYAARRLPAIEYMVRKDAK